jgi:hypothetical protein
LPTAEGIVGLVKKFSFTGVIYLQQVGRVEGLHFQQDWP